jgi:hypothetical protein
VKQNAKEKMQIGCSVWWTNLLCILKSWTLVHRTSLTTARGKISALQYRTLFKTGFVYILGCNIYLWLLHNHVQPFCQRNAQHLKQTKINSTIHLFFVWLGTYLDNSLTIFWNEKVLRLLSIKVHIPVIDVNVTKLQFGNLKHCFMAATCIKKKILPSSFKSTLVVKFLLNHLQLPSAKLGFYKSGLNQF